MAKKDDQELDPDQSYASALRELIGIRFGAVWSAVPVAIEGVDPEGVHDVRVASRRLRAAMDIAEGCFPSSWFKPLHQVAKMFTDELGAVRDRDVLLAFLESERASAPPAEQAGLDRLIARVSREREQARAEMLEFLAGIEQQGVAREAVKRFGKSARPPWATDDEP